ncbi:MAG: LysM peptidoglycan-binding domain-containing protein [Deltaproteobacteria bacterium]|nr:MAG: LysM peptidoglycan-binding domain-containing protein [Deltaproteobacteria bacterium]
MTSRALPSTALAIAALAAAAGARADTAPTAPGPQACPPGPPPPAAQPPLQPDDDQRRAVRACSVGRDCHRAADLMLEFERETFPRPGHGSPWIDVDGPMARADASRGHRHAPDNDPRALRPDLPWLADLELPDLPVHWDDRIIAYLEFYKNDPRGRTIMAAWLRDQGRFADLILDALRDARLPEDLLYVAMIESSYDVWEYSRTGAAGLWQFMPGTARIYGLRVDRWVDERYDPVRSTEAAVLMWQDLYQRFGNWELALAAYNAGYGNVAAAIAKYNTNDFWQLLEYEAGLPWGSRIYVPKAIATAIVGHNRERFGFADIEPAPRHEFDVVTVPTSVSFATIARAAGTDADTIARLNPHLKRRRTPPGEANFPVRIPKGRAALFAERFPQLRGDWDGYTAYVARHGERLEDIATTFGLSRSELAELNGITDEAEISGGMTLVVPVVSEEQQRENRKKAHDDLYRSSLPPGGPDDPLLVAVPDKDLRVPGKRRWFYRVVAGDTLWGIAKAWHVDLRALAEWNGLNADAHLQPRMVLQVWAAPDFDPNAHGIAVLDETRLHIVQAGSEEHIALAEGRLGRRRTIYTVKRGGTLADVGKLYGLSKYDLARINRKPPDTELKAGDQVIVYEVVDPSKSRRAARQLERQRKAQRRSKRRKRR